MENYNTIEEVQARIKELDREYNEHVNASTQCYVERNTLMKKIDELECEKHKKYINKFVKYVFKGEVYFIFVTEVYAWGVGGPAITFNHVRSSRIEYCDFEVARFSSHNNNVKIIDDINNAIAEIQSQAEATMSSITEHFRIKSEEERQG